MSPNGVILPSDPYGDARSSRERSDRRCRANLRGGRRPAEQAVEFLRHVLVQRLEDVAVDAHRDRDVAVPQSLHDELGVGAERDHQRRARVAEIVRSERLWQAGAQQRGAHDLLSEALTIERPALRGAKHVVVRLERAALLGGEPRETLARLCPAPRSRSRERRTGQSVGVDDASGPARSEELPDIPWERVAWLGIAFAAAGIVAWLLGGWLPGVSLVFVGIVMAGWSLSARAARRSGKEVSPSDRNPTHDPQMAEVPWEHVAWLGGALLAVGVAAYVLGSGLLRFLFLAPGAALMTTYLLAKAMYPRRR